MANQKHARNKIFPLKIFLDCISDYFYLKENQEFSMMRGKSPPHLSILCTYIEKIKSNNSLLLKTIWRGRSQYYYFPKIIMLYLFTYIFLKKYGKISLFFSMRLKLAIFIDKGNLK